MRCNFIKFTDTSGTSDPISLQFGIWYYRFWSLVTSVDGTFIFESCHEYPDFVDLDASWKAARAFSALAAIFGIAIFLSSIVSSCVSSARDALVHGWMAPAYLLTATFQGLSLLLLNSNACKNNLQIKDLEYITFPD